MTVTFPESNYKSVVPDHYSVESKAKKNLNFQYVDLTYAQFSNQRFQRSEGQISDEGMHLRVCAIPMAIYTALLAVYDIGIAIFSDVPQAFQGDTDPLLTRTYTIIRDLQAIFGRIVSLIIPSYGLYHIEESQYHRACYELFLTQVQ